MTCGDAKEASRIANTLLVKHLVACTKQFPITADFRWQGTINKSKEVLLVMDSRTDLFEKVEKEVAKIHSYDTFVLLATQIVRISKSARLWLEKELNHEQNKF